MKLIQKHILGQNVFHGVLSTTFVISDTNQGLIAVASQLWTNTWYDIGLNSIEFPKYRVSLFHSKTFEQLGVIECKEPIHDMSFHPNKPLLAIASGSYDGGYLYEGNCIIWNYKRNQSRSLLRENREVTSVKFEKDETLTITVSPEDDEDLRKHHARYVYRVRNDDSKQTLQDLEWIETVPFVNLYKSVQEQENERQACIEQLKKLAPNYEYRGPIVDVLWYNKEELFCTGSEPFLEKWHRFSREKVISGVTGLQLFKSTEDSYLYVHFEKIEYNEKMKTKLPSYYVACYDPSSVKQVKKRKIDVPAIMSQGNNGMLLFKRLIPVLPFTETPSQDILLNSQLQLVSSWNRKRHSFQYQNKNYEILDKGGNISLKQKSKMSMETVTFFSHNHGYFIEDESGKGKILAERMTPEPLSALTRFDHEEKVVWQKEFEANIIDHCHLLEKGVIVVALSNGIILLLCAKTGESLDEQKVKIDHGQSPIISLDSYGNQIAAGTIDGMILCYEVA